MVISANGFNYFEDSKSAIFLITLFIIIERNFCYVR